MKLLQIGSEPNIEGVRDIRIVYQYRKANQHDYLTRHYTTINDGDVIFIINYIGMYAYGQILVGDYAGKYIAMRRDDWRFEKLQ